MPEWKKLLVGDYNYGWLCMPVWPFGASRKTRKASPFIPLHAPLGILVAIVMGLQHALAMVGGIITPPLLIYRTTVPEDEKDADLEQYMISAALIVSGICSAVQVWRFGIPTPGVNGGKTFIGTGMVSVMGISFAFLPVAQSSVTTMIADGYSWRHAYGRILGTAMVGSLLQISLSFTPPKVLKRIFPPLITGTAVFLIGASLLGSGIRNWGGGAFCAANYKGLPAAKINGCMVPDAVGNLVPGECYKAQVVPTCSNNGEVMLKFGSAEYMGLGAIVFLTLILVELFGSPAMRNVQVVIGLLVGYIIAAAVSVDGKRFVTSDKIDAAPGITFLWVKTFPLGFYAPALLPMLIAYTVSSIESIGDIYATAEASMLDLESEEQAQRVQGGVLNDGISCLFAALATVLPATSYAQNNGVISLTRCASRWVGIACAAWLICLGVLSKIAAFITTIPDCVLGGMTSFLFANVAVSGIKILSSNGIMRRDRFVLAIGLALGLGVIIVNYWTTNNLWPLRESYGDGMQGFRDAVLITIGSGYSMGVLAAVALNFLLPYELEEDAPEDEFDSFADPSVKRNALKDTDSHANDLDKPAVNAPVLATGV